MRAVFSTPGSEISPPGRADQNVCRVGSAAYKRGSADTVLSTTCPARHLAWKQGTLFFRKEASSPKFKIFWKLFPLKNHRVLDLEADCWMRLGKKIPEDAPDWFWQAVCRLDMYCCSSWSAIFYVRPFVFLTTMMTSSSHAQVSATCMSGHTTHLRCTHWRYRTEECSKGSSDSLDFGTNFLHFHPLRLFPMPSIKST